MSNLSADVLIIEDDIWLSEQFERTLQRAGCQTVSTSNALRAMELIDQSPPQVIILDMLLGGASGLTLLHELQSYTDTAKIPVILCTNMASSIDKKDVEPYGIRRILDKTTMHPDDIVVAVRGALL
ncbi:TPA: response regulator [Candidatus Saccharibacteria bacterium]|nr:MAG: hypothetical protein UW38_C0001G1046 [Candidatus Saccharibacteria bacterium GW2011_GWC2_44_17]MBH1956528.1 response regulator [Candidatus Saccharibacteria bacterium]OGL23113.1 MAG: hypothetical protein A2791_05550 [Candidatus Saccharibacteria bacterium RIFCSPHIGHO2_01_FULL_46_30]OGL34150.1 MAG: hypothetical protein A3E20_04585 [Candidatus Saccharibacteria bacterium RIFCSPHIGHO2_12_FULL_47_16]MBH1972916.1 response regulator [Candidatus Saccharibacteria bacterium]